MIFTRKEAEAYGLAQRNHLARSGHHELPKRRFDPMEVVRVACRDHVAKLLPVKFERMSESPFAFFRGAVEIMAADLGAGKRTEIIAQLCGDAHLKNFGFYATPSSEVILDINDFDHTIRGPWEWDVKRCAASIM